MVTDNGTCFTSSEFEEFAQCNNIRHVHIAPYQWLGRKGSADFQVGDQEATHWYVAD